MPIIIILLLFLLSFYYAVCVCVCAGGEERQRKAHLGQESLPWNMRAPMENQKELKSEKSFS